MNTMKNLFKLLLLVAFTLVSCQDDDTNFGAITAPSNLVVSATVLGTDAANPAGDGSGMVSFTASADNALNYRFEFGDNRNESAASGQVMHRYVEQGVNTYTVVVVATGTGGASTSTTVEVSVFSAFADDEALQLLTGGSSKTWYWAAAEGGHLGVGPNFGNGAAEDNFAAYYMAAPFEKNGTAESQCLYQDQLVFSLDNGSLKYELLNMGQTYFNVDYESVTGGTNGYDFCYDFDTSGVKDVTLSPTDSFVPDVDSRKTSMLFSDGGFMSYYIGSSDYEILSITENRLYVRSIPGSNSDLAWYHIFSTDDPNNMGGGGGGGNSSNFNTLVFEDDFNVDGAPDPSVWTYDIGVGGAGWGNNEQQYYTSNSSNVIVDNGSLKITARREPTNGSDFSSARIKTENLYEFTYGRVEARAKLPTGGGTWPAIWTLGANFDTVSWPACGELDVMEHIGNNQDVIYGTAHYPGNSGGNANGSNITVPGVSNDFHIYEMEWTDTQITWSVDGTVFHTLANDSSLPFNSDFFFIMNVAMGGNFGGAIDPAFTESTMEVDYIRLYQ